MSTTSNSKALFSIVAAAVCGAVLILITVTSRNGLLMYLPYLGLAAACVLYLRRLSLDSFVSRFSIAFTAYAVATAIIWLYINMFVDPRVLRPLTLRNVAGPLAAMIVIGAVGSAIVSLLAQPRRSNDRLVEASLRD
jgi:hypothetical protein